MHLRHLAPGAILSQTAPNHDNYNVARRFQQSILRRSCCQLALALPENVVDAPGSLLKRIQKAFGGRCFQRDFNFDLRHSFKYRLEACIFGELKLMLTVTPQRRFLSLWTSHILLPSKLIKDVKKLLWCSLAIYFLTPSRLSIKLFQFSSR
jgi:hypothetical protein